MRLCLNRIILIVCAFFTPILAHATTAPSISISPGYTTIGVSSTLQYTATVTGLTNTSVTWMINGVVGGNTKLGTITPSGLYTSPAVSPGGSILVEALASNKTTMAEVYVVIQPLGPPITSISPSPIPLGNYTITVVGSGFLPGATVRNGNLMLSTTYVNSTTLTASGYQGSTGMATLTVSNPYTLLGPAFVAPFAGAQSVSPSTATVTVGKTQQFTSAGATSWTATAGTISSTGLYTAPASLPTNPSVTITAKGSNGTGTAAVTLVGAAPQTISPSATTVILGKTQQFTSTGATSWSASAGTISSTGLYTAPATMPASASVTVTATGPNGSAPATVTLVAPQVISPTSATVILGKTQQFTAAGATSWTASAGTISSTGLYNAPTTMPASASVTVTASGPGGSASAILTLLAPQSITPTSTTVLLGQTQQFTSAGATSWSATAGTISSTGLYTAPATMPASALVTITATGSNGSASATVTLTAPQAISPTAASVLLGRTQQFTSAGATSWSATAGTISSTGLYTAPATMPGSALVTVTATGSNGSVSATVTLTAPQAISPTAASVLLGQSQQFTSAGATSWSATAGTISSTGLYTAPVTMPGSALVTVTASGPNGSASATVTLTAPQTISPAVASVTVGQTQQFISAGATSWSATVGTVSSTGLYTAPATMPASALVTVTATGPNGSASATVTLVAPAAQTISPQSATVGIGKSQQFTSTGATSWTASAGSITPTGLYTAPATMPASTLVTVTATGPGGSASATVTLTSSTALAVSPSSASILLGQTQQFTAPGATSWYVNAGSISSTGLYTAPTTMPANPLVAVLVNGPNGAALAAVNLVAAPTQTITPATVSVTLGQPQQFTSPGATTWTATAGTITSTGLYLAPTTMPGTNSVLVSATGPIGTATAMITLTSPTTQLVSPSSVSLVVGQTQQFTSSGATSWTASVGTISSTGLYTAPATLPAVTTAAITATGPLGTATATVLLVAATLPAGQVSISTEAPYYGWELIPGATRRIHATVTNGATNEVSWTYTTTGGATATLTPAPSPNILGAFVDVTLGPVGSTCTNIGTVTNPVFSSTASVTLTATSVDDPTQSTTVPIQVCSPQVQVYVSPFNVRLYSGQTTDLQSWVWGTANDNVVWTITQPQGGNGKLIAPPAGGSANTNRDAVFSATVAGNYTVTATSAASPGVSASATISVDSAPMPSYAVTPNHTAPVDCSVDPTQIGTTYDVGPGHPYAMLADAYVAIGSNILSPGTTIRLFNADTTGTNPTRYHEYLRLDGQGAQTAPIRIVGCPDAAGNLPIMDASNATAYSPTDNSVAAGISGLYQIGFHHSGSFAIYPTYNGPSYVIIEGLAFRNAYPTTGANANYFYTAGSSTPTQWGTAVSCIRPYEGAHVTVRGNDMEDCSFGILADFNGNNDWGGFFGDFDLEGNYFTNIGAANSSEHMAYVQGFRQLIQGNVFDQMKSVSGGGELKMRGVAEVVRYNFFNSSSNSRTIDFVEEQDSNIYMSFLGYYYTPSGSVSFHTVYPNDAYTPDMIAAADEAWHKAYAYGNIINFGPNTPNSQAPIHFFGDQGQYADVNTNPPVRVGDLFDYNNTFYSVGNNTMHFVDTMQNQDNQVRWEWPTLTLWNNAIYLGPMNAAAGQEFQMSNLRSDIYNIGPTWISSNWGNNTLTCSNNTMNACVGTGWPFYNETTGYMDSNNLPAHINGLSNLIIGGSTVPFSTTTFAPTSGGGLVGAGAPLPATVSNMPVRFQISAPSYALQPRTNPLTLGAHD